jgi:hypothetical protein
VTAQYADRVTRDEALAEVGRRRSSDPDGTWIAMPEGSSWTVARIARTRVAQAPSAPDRRPPLRHPAPERRSPAARSG